MRGRDYIKKLLIDQMEQLKEGERISGALQDARIRHFDFQVRIAQLAEDYGVDLPVTEADFE